MHISDTGSSPIRVLTRRRSARRRARHTVAAATALLALAAGALATTAQAAPAAPARAAAVAPAAPVGPAGSTGPAGSSSPSDVTEFGCARPALPGQARCFGLVERRHSAPSTQMATPSTTGSPTTSGYVPSDLLSAYNLGGTSGAGRTVAIVDAQDDPNAESDLATYRSAYGLPACTTANGCFRKVNQNGKASPLPAGDYGWAMEISLDLDMVSAVCPGCHILLVEADSAYTSDLVRAEDQAASTPGVAAISNSWGESEEDDITSFDSHFNHPGVAITASSGDSGYGATWPASSPYLTSVGGTSLNKASDARGWAETAWSGAGSGCSAYEPKSAWQHDAGCGKRTVADVSAVADPATGVAVSDTYNSCGGGSWCDLLLSIGLAQGSDGWIQVGGTSVSSPIIASIYTLAGNTGQTVYGSYPYSHTAALYDVTSGSNGSCSTSYLCTAGPGYDGPTGLGTPNGTGAF